MKFKLGVMGMIGLVLIFGIFSCKENVTTVIPVASYLGHSECGNVWSQSRGSGLQNDIRAGQNEIVQWSYLNRTLTISHVNACFNCCPEIGSEIKVDGNTILVTEVEIKGECHCLCLMTLKYEVTNLHTGNFKLKITSPYIPNHGGPVEVDINCSEGGSGRAEFVRGVYPWDVPAKR